MFDLKMNWSLLVVLGLSWIPIFNAKAAAQTATVVLRRGEPVPGAATNSPIVYFADSAQNSVGGYAFSVRTEDGGFHFYGKIAGDDELSTLRSSGTDLYDQYEIFHTFGLSDDGTLIYTSMATDRRSGEEHRLVLWRDSEIILKPYDPISLPQSICRGCRRADVTFAGVPYWEMGYDDGVVYRHGLFYANDGNVLLTSGQLIDGVGELGRESHWSSGSKLSGLGTYYLSSVWLEPPSGIYRDNAILLNGDAMMINGSRLQTGFSVPFGLGEFFARFDSMDINESGQYLIGCRSNASLETNDFLILNDEVVLREGDTVDGFELFGGIWDAAINEDGDWAVLWSGHGEILLDPKALIVNGELVIDDLVDVSDADTLSIGERNDAGQFTVCFATPQYAYVVTMQTESDIVTNVESFDVTEGTLVSGTVELLADSDDDGVVSRRSASDLQSRVFVEFTGTSPTESPSQLTFTLEGFVFSRSAVTQSIDLFDYQTNSWEEVDVRMAGRFKDLVTTVLPAGDLSRFVNPATLATKSRVRFQNPIPRQQFAASLDQVVWTISY